MRSILFAVSNWDPAVLAGVAALLGGVALFASYVPARRATNDHPVGGAAIQVAGLGIVQLGWKSLHSEQSRLMLSLVLREVLAFTLETMAQHNRCSEVLVSFGVAFAATCLRVHLGSS